MPEASPEPTAGNVPAMPVRADGFTDRVRHEAHCCIARAAGRDERRYLWI